MSSDTSDSVDSEDLFGRYANLLDWTKSSNDSNVDKDNKPVAVSGSEEPDKNRVFKAEWKRIIQFKDLRGNTQVVAMENYRKGKAKKEIDGKFKDSAMLLRKVLTVDGQLQDYRLEIQSHGLQDIFQAIARPFGELDLDASPIIIKPPFRSLFFLRDQFKELSQAATTAEETKKELEQLLEFIHSEDGLQDLISEYEQHVPHGKVTFDLLWTLYPPQELVYHSFSHASFQNDAAFLIDSITVLSNNTGYKQGKDGLEVTLLSGYHDGTNFGLSKRYVTVSEFYGVRNISEIMPLPVKYMETQKWETLRQSLIDRGKRYFKLRADSYTFLNYVGPLTILEKDNARNLGLFRVEDGMSHDWEVSRHTFKDLGQTTKLTMLSTRVRELDVE
jgi:hypothetical protein